MSNPYTNCTQCPHHSVLPDPDPIDWFNNDDVKVLCTNGLCKRSVGKRYITSMCRPYQIEAECDIPSWCPYNEEGINRSRRPLVPRRDDEITRRLDPDL